MEFAIETCNCSTIDTKIVGILKSIDESCDLRYEKTTVQRSWIWGDLLSWKNQLLHRIWLQTYGKIFPKLSLCGWHNRINSHRNGYPNYDYWKRGISIISTSRRCIDHHENTWSLRSVIMDHKNSILQIVGPHQRKNIRITWCPEMNREYLWIVMSRVEAHCVNVGRNGRRGIRRYWSRRSTGRASGSDEDVHPNDAAQRPRRTAPLSYLIKPPRCCTELEQLCRRHRAVMVTVMSP